MTWSRSAHGDGGQWNRSIESTKHPSHEPSHRRPELSSPEPRSSFLPPTSFQFLLTILTPLLAFFCPPSPFRLALFISQAVLRAVLNVAAPGDTLLAWHSSQCRCRADPRLSTILNGSSS